MNSCYRMKSSPASGPSQHRVPLVEVNLLRKQTKQDASYNVKKEKFQGMPKYLNEMPFIPNTGANSPRRLGVANMLHQPSFSSVVLTPLIYSHPRSPLGRRLARPVRKSAGDFQDFQFRALGLLLLISRTWKSLSKPSTYHSLFSSSFLYCFRTSSYMILGLVSFE